MSIYSPVVIGETEMLRTGVEGMLSQHGSAVKAHLEGLTETARDAGFPTTFGTEIEFLMPADPSAEQVSSASDNDLYVEIVAHVQEDRPINARRNFPKGAVIQPSNHPEPIMITRTSRGDITCNNDQQGSGILEVRTAPADAIEAADRYWQTIQAIGIVAARHGRMGVLLGTHVSAAVWENEDDHFINYHTLFGGKVIAAVQHNLNSMSTLQMDAGMDTGLNVTEAFPHSKDASTTVHDERLEFRHPVVGIADPRIDMLATLDGVLQAANETIPTRALQDLRPCRKVETDGLVDDDYAINYALEDIFSHLTIWDERSKRFVIPSVLEHGARGSQSEYMLDNCVCTITDGAETSLLADNGRTMRAFTGALRLKDRTLHLAPKSQFAATINQTNLARTDINFGRRVFRTLPRVTYDSPEAHADRRRNVIRSSTVRRLMGAACFTLTAADEAIAGRQEMVDNAMIALEDEDRDI